MTLVKFKQKPLESRYNELLENLFQPFTGRVTDDFSFVNSSVPVNIRETEQSFIVEVVAPGFDKSDFNVQVNEQLLTISAEKRDDSPKQNERQIRREFTRKSFTRTFSVDESIETDKICAKYVNGLLQLELPKKEEVKMEPKAIQVQ